MLVLPSQRDSRAVTPGQTIWSVLETNLIQPQPRDSCSDMMPRAPFNRVASCRCLRLRKDNLFRCLLRLNVQRLAAVRARVPMGSREMERKAVSNSEGSP